jgi:hypothetical protein
MEGVITDPLRSNEPGEGCVLRHSRKRKGHVIFPYCVTSPPRALPSDSPSADEENTVPILLATCVAGVV